MLQDTRKIRAKNVMKMLWNWVIPQVRKQEREDLKDGIVFWSYNSNLLHKLNALLLTRKSHVLWRAFKSPLHTHSWLSASITHVMSPKKTKVRPPWDNLIFWRRNISGGGRSRRGGETRQHISAIRGNTNKLIMYNPPKQQKQQKAEFSQNLAMGIEGEREGTQKYSHNK